MKKETPSYIVLDWEAEDLKWRLLRSANQKRILREQYEVLLAIKRLKELPKP